MKKFISFLVILSAICGFAAFGGCNNQEANTHEPPTTDETGGETDEKKETAEEIYFKQYGHKFCYDHYYGSFEGADAYFSSGSTAAVYGIMIGGCIFKYGYDWVIYIFKDSTVYMLEDAYKSGILSKQAVADLAVAHVKYVRSVTGFSDEAFNEWYYDEDICKIID